LGFKTYLNRAVVDEEAVQFLEGLASAVRLGEGDIGDTAALRVGAVRKLDPLDGTDRLDKVFLWWEKVDVSEPAGASVCVNCFSANPTSTLGCVTPVVHGTNRKKKNPRANRTSKRASSES